MYEQFFGLARAPFLMTPDPHFLFLTPAHREALAGLVYAIVKRKGVALLTGDAGTGKTTLIRTVLASVPEETAHFGLLIHPTLNSEEFLEMILLELGIDSVPDSKTRRLIALERLLLREHEEGRAVVLVVDEAHKLSPQALEEVRLLTNLENAAGKLLQIVLSAQVELDGMLARPELRQLKQRIAYRFTIQPLSPESVTDYVAYRWRLAGGKLPHPFSEDALDYIAMFSGGIPRVINAMCDNALLSAYAADSTEIRAEHIVVVASDLACQTGPALDAPESAGEPLPAGPVPIDASEAPAPGLLPTLERYRSRRWRLGRWHDHQSPAG